jgi:hypothetical protein
MKYLTLISGFCLLSVFSFGQTNQTPQNNTPKTEKSVEQKNTARIRVKQANVVKSNQNLKANDAATEIQKNKSEIKKTEQPK